MHAVVCLFGIQEAPLNVYSAAHLESCITIVRGGGLHSTVQYVIEQLCNG